VEFETRDQLNAVESRHIRENECVNKVQPGRTDAQYRIDNRENTRAYQIANAAHIRAYRETNADEIRAYHAKYRERNSTKIKEKHVCECGGKFTTKNKSTHLQTLMHQAWETKKE